eukprot:Polyplicarium_translucidae@DN3015_c0_g1_i1.p1
MPTMEQAKEIQAHWNANVADKLQKVGNTLFQEFFAANPGDQKLFKKFAGVANADLPSNAAFNAQTLAVMNYLAKVVAGLGGNAKDLMKAQVAPHKPRNVGKAEFKRMFDFLPGFMERHGGPGAAWTAGGVALLAAMY